MKYCFIINPASGKPQSKEGLEDKILECARAHGVDAIIMKTEQAGDMQRYIAKIAEEHASEQICIYACGGDGTLCEAVGGIMALPDRSGIYLGVVPVGTGNDFVRNFGGKEPFLDIDAQLEASPIDVDLLKCNDTYCVNMVNIGFDCQVVVKTAKIKRHRLVPSRLAYILGLAATLIKKPGAHIELSADGQDTEKKELLLTTFANGSFCGGGFNSNPKANLCDGRINALYVNNISRTKFVSIVGKYKSGTHLDGGYADIVSTEWAQEYSLSFDKPTEISVDGEIITVDGVNIRCIPEAVKILLPRGCEYARREAVTL